MKPSGLFAGAFIELIVVSYTESQERPNQTDDEVQRPPWNPVSCGFVSAWETSDSLVGNVALERPEVAPGATLPPSSSTRFCSSRSAKESRQECRLPRLAQGSHRINPEFNSPEAEIPDKLAAPAVASGSESRL